MENDFAVLRDLVRNVVVSPDVRLQGVSSFHRRYSIDKGSTFKNVIPVSRISSETERVKDRARRYYPLSCAPRRLRGRDEAHRRRQKAIVGAHEETLGREKT